MIEGIPRIGFNNIKTSVYVVDEVKIELVTDRYKTFSVGNRMHVK